MVGKGLLLGLFVKASSVAAGNFLFADSATAAAAASLQSLSGLYILIGMIGR